MLNILIGHTRPLEKALGCGFTLLGHNVYHCHNEVLGLPYEKLSRWLKARNIDLIIFPCPSTLPPTNILKKLKKKHICIFWEKEASHELARGRRGIKYYFTTRREVKNSFYLPFAGLQRGWMVAKKRSDFVLLAKDKSKEDTLRGVLHREIKKDIGGMYKLMGNIPPHLYHRERFRHLSKSLASIGIWNDYLWKEGKPGVPIRYFDSFSCQVSVLTYPHKGLRELFTPNEHYIESVKLKPALEYYSRYPKDLIELGQKAYKHMLCHHTYLQRAEFILEVLKAHGEI